MQDPKRGIDNMRGTTENIADILPAKSFYYTKNRGVENRTSTPDNLPDFSIEGIVIEKKEGSTKLNGFRKQQLNKLRYVNNTAYTVNNELVLPKEIMDLVDNKMFLPRHKKLARDYGVDWLLKLSELAKTKGKPSHWYAKVTSKNNWKQTEEMLQGLLKKIDQMKEKLQGLRVPAHWIPYFVGAKDKLSEAEFNNCVELAGSRGVKKPPNLLAKAVKKCIDSRSEPCPVV